jgi:hypothetical protein
MSQTGHRIGTSLLLLCLIIGCNEQGSEQAAPIIEEIDALTPEKIWSIDHVGDLYFSHLGYESVVLENGNIAFADRELPTIVILNEEGQLQKNIRSGRGPGEILDAYRFTKDKEGNIFTYDQDNDKLMLFDKNFDLKREIIPPVFESTTLHKAYPSGKEGLFNFELISFEYLRDQNKNRENILIGFDSENESYGGEKILEAQPYARIMIDGQVRGASLIPYSYGNLTAYNPNNGTIFTFHTATDEIAELNADLDTVRTIPIKLPTEKISSVEMDSMEAESNDLRWDALKDVIPEVKAPADDMFYHNGNFWLESNILGETEMWLVVNNQGKIINVVHLPKESTLTHVDDDHLGLRLNDVTFALFTNPVAN